MTATPDKTVLLTGFETFGEFDSNPSADIARALDKEDIAGYHIKGIVLPVEFGKSGKALINAIRETSPAVVVCLGLAGKRQDIALERLAVNLDDAEIPDNAGNQPVDEPVVADGPPAYWSTLPLKSALGMLRDNGIPASLSMSAGTYVCNHVFYQLMHHLQSTDSMTTGGFIHLPLPDSFAGHGVDPGMTVLTRGVKMILQSVLTDS